MTQLGQWRSVDHTRRLKPLANQGLTTIAGTGGTTTQRYRGGWSVPRRLKRLGWVHIGDPDSAEGHFFDCYQGKDGATSKLFEVTTPGGEHLDFEHRLEGDELMNNSYVAVSPDGQWMLSGEWGVMRRILVFPTPVLNPSAPPAGSSLPLAGAVALDHPVRNVQGATFVSPTLLLASTDDPDTDLWPAPRQLLQIELDTPVAGGTTQGRVTCLGGLPTASRCRGTAEVEGLDYDPTTGDLRVVVVSPSVCGFLVLVHRFRQ